MDPVLFEIMRNKALAIADEICLTLMRTSRSVFVNEGADFAVGLIDVNGEIFAWAPSNKTTSVNVPAKRTLELMPNLEPGDVIVTNDPYISAGMATHLPDLHMIRPYFHKGRIVGYGWLFIHYMDVGGKVPGSVSESCSEIFQEGLRIPPMKVLKKGELNQNFVKIFRANCRLPDTNMADIHSSLGALAVGENRCLETIAQYGAKAFIDCQEAMQEYSDTKTRDVIRRLRDGVYDFWDFLDDDMVTSIPIRVRLRLTVKDDTMHFDLTGTDPQVEASYNIPTMGTLHNMLTRRITTFIRTHDKSIPVNAGMYRPMSITSPPGTVLNAEFPDAVGVRFTTATSFNNAVTGALLKADNTMMAGSTCGTGGSIVLTEFLPGETAATVTIVQSLRGGMSAYKGMDGVDVRDVTMNTMHNHPIETIENKCGVRIVEYDVRTDSCGAGQWRGGAGQVMTVEILRDGGTVQLSEMDRFRFPSWGAAGGLPGETIHCVFNRGRADESVIGKTEEFPVNKGDTVTVMMPGAAGFGDPFQRDPEAVRWDVERGFVGRAAAEREYGVVIDGAGAVDAAATDKSRRARVRENIGSDFDFGPEREAWESVFDDETMCELNRLLYAFPKSVRQAKRRAVFHAALPEIPKAGSGTLTGVLSEPDAVRARLKAAMGDILGAGATLPAEQAAQ